MNDDKRPELETLDPDSEECLQALASEIDDEIAARIAVGNDPSTSDGRRAISELIADKILDRFIVRKRTNPRYRWRDS